MSKNGNITSYMTLAKKPMPEQTKNPRPSKKARLDKDAITTAALPAMTVPVAAQQQQQLPVPSSPPQGKNTAKQARVAQREFQVEPSPELPQTPKAAPPSALPSFASAVSLRRSRSGNADDIGQRISALKYDLEQLLESQSQAYWDLRTQKDEARREKAKAKARAFNAKALAKERAFSEKREREYEAHLAMKQQLEEMHGVLQDIAVDYGRGALAKEKRSFAECLNTSPPPSAPQQTSSPKKRFGAGFDEDDDEDAGGDNYDDVDTSDHYDNRSHEGSDVAMGGDFGGDLDMEYEDNLNSQLAEGGEMMDEDPTQADTEDEEEEELLPSSRGISGILSLSKDVFKTPQKKYPRSYVSPTHTLSPGPESVDILSSLPAPPPQPTEPTRRKEDPKPSRPTFKAGSKPSGVLRHQQKKNIESRMVIEDSQTQTTSTTSTSNKTNDNSNQLEILSQIDIPPNPEDDKDSDWRGSTAGLEEVESQPLISAAMRDWANQRPSRQVKNIPNYYDPKLYDKSDDVALTSPPRKAKGKGKATSDGRERAVSMEPELQFLETRSIAGKSGGGGGGRQRSVELGNGDDDEVRIIETKKKTENIYDRFQAVSTKYPGFFSTSGYSSSAQ